MAPAARDPVLRALGGLATGAAGGAAIITAGLLLLRTVQLQGAGSQDPASLVLSTAVLVGMVVAAASGWLLSRGIEEFWRRGVTATLAVFGAVMLALPAIPADWLGGRGGLVAYLALLLAGALYAWAHARQAA